MDTSCGAPAHGRRHLRLWGVTTVLFSIISLGIAIGVDTYMDNIKLGFWYIALISMSAGLLVVSAMSRGVVIACLIISIVAIILGIAGSLVDGAYANVLLDLRSCITNDNFYYGSSNPTDMEYASVCLDKQLGETQYDCYCSNGNGDCYYFTGQTDCANIFGHYTKIVRAATAFDVLVLLSVFGLSIITCCSLCCPQNLGSDEDLYVNNNNNNNRNSQNVSAAYVVSTGNVPTVIVVEGAQNGGGMLGGQRAAGGVDMPATATAVPVYGDIGMVPGKVYTR